MKSTLFFLLILVLFFINSCSKSNTGNNNNPPTVTAPVSPSGLTVIIVSASQVNLSWVDNSSNETGFTIERKTGAGAYSAISASAANITAYNDIGLSANTTYSYRVIAFNSAGNSPGHTNEVTITTPGVIVLTTSAISAVTMSSAISGGNITNDGGSPITARGVVWNTSNNPTVALSTKTSDGTGTGSFASNITGLTANTIYYVRSYATNTGGTSYGNEVIFTSAPPNITDVDGNSYPTILVCSQIWMQKNLDVTHYRNGDVIPQQNGALPPGTGAWSYYNNDPAMGAIYGKLYNWYAVTDPRGLAPAGWHTPFRTDWNKLVKCLDPSADTTCLCTTSNIAGGQLKEPGTIHWLSPNASATNSSGFTALPTGVQTGTSTFFDVGKYCTMWYNEEQIFSNGYTFALSYQTGIAALNGNYTKNFGLGVRCVKD